MFLVWCRDGEQTKLDFCVGRRLFEAIALGVKSRLPKIFFAADPVVIKMDSSVAVTLTPALMFAWGTNPPNAYPFYLEDTYHLRKIDAKTEAWKLSERSVFLSKVPKVLVDYANSRASTAYGEVRIGAGEPCGVGVIPGYVSSDVVKSVNDDAKNHAELSEALKAVDHEAITRIVRLSFLQRAWASRPTMCDVKKMFDGRLSETTLPNWSGGQCSAGSEGSCGPPQPTGYTFFLTDGVKVVSYNTSEALVQTRAYVVPFNAATDTTGREVRQVPCPFTCLVPSCPLCTVFILDYRNVHMFLLTCMSSSKIQNVLVNMYVPVNMHVIEQEPACEVDRVKVHSIAICSMPCIGEGNLFRTLTLIAVFDIMLT